MEKTCETGIVAKSGNLALNNRRGASPGKLPIDMYPTNTLRGHWNSKDIVFLATGLGLVL